MQTEGNLQRPVAIVSMTEHVRFVEPEAERRDSPSPSPNASMPPPPNRSGASTSTGAHAAGEASASQTHIGGIPHISPRVHKQEHSHSMTDILGADHLGTTNLGSPRHFPRRDRSLSLGHYPPSFLANGSFSFSPGPSPVPATMPPYRAEHMPFMPNLSPSGPTRAAMEAAVHSERMRAKEKEKEEENMTADELKAVLKRERSRMSKISADLAALRSAAGQSQAEAEVHEEGRINHLMRRVECLQQEKGRIILELEREEEMLTNTLQKKLDEVRWEKNLLEQQIEREHQSNFDLKSSLASIRGTEGESILDCGEDTGSIQESTKQPDSIPMQFEREDSIPEGDEEQE